MNNQSPMIISRLHIFVSLSLEIIMKIILNMFDNHRNWAYILQLDFQGLLLMSVSCLKEIMIIQRKKNNHLNHLYQFLRVIQQSHAVIN